MGRMIDREETILVTGASSGIGAAIARHLAGQGLSVLAVHYRTSPPKDSPSHMRWIQCDLADVHEPLLEACGDRLTTIIHCAVSYGVNRRHGFTETTDAEWQRVFAINVEAQFRLTRALLPRLRTASKGFIIGIDSVAADLAGGRIAYGASKAAARCMLNSLATELHKSNVGVVQLLPTVQVLTEGIRARRPSNFSFAGYASATVINPTIDWVLTQSPGQVNGKILNVP